MGAELERGLEIIAIVGWVFAGINLYAVINFLLYTLLTDPDSDPIMANILAVFFPWLYWVSKFRDWLNKRVNEF